MATVYYAFCGLLEWTSPRVQPFLSHYGIRTMLDNNDYGNASAAYYDDDDDEEYGTILVPLKHQGSTNLSRAQRPSVTGPSISKKHFQNNNNTNKQSSFNNNLHSPTKSSSPRKPNEQEWVELLSQRQSHRDTHQEALELIRKVERQRSQEFDDMMSQASAASLEQPFDDEHSVGSNTSSTANNKKTMTKRGRLGRAFSGDGGSLLGRGERGRKPPKRSASTSSESRLRSLSKSSNKAKESKAPTRSKSTTLLSMVRRDRSTSRETSRGRDNSSFLPTLPKRSRSSSRSLSPDNDSRPARDRSPKRGVVRSISSKAKQVLLLQGRNNNKSQK